MQLFKINQAIERIVEGENFIDYETGEFLGKEDLDALELDRAEKIKGLLCVIKNKQSYVKALKEQIDAFKDRMEGELKQIEGAKSYLTYCAEGTNFESAEATLKWRASKTLQVLDEAKVPSAFKITKTTEMVVKADLKKYIEQGNEIEGVSIVLKNNPQIK